MNCFHRFENQDKTREHLEQMKGENEKKIQRLEEEKGKLEQELERFKYSGEAKLSRFLCLLVHFDVHLSFSIIYFNSYSFTNGS